MDRLIAMQAFVTVVEAGSFSAAARLLRVGQPAVSKTIAQLERRVGSRLLLRSTRALRVTEAGLMFFEHAKRAIEEADEAELAARGAGTKLSGRLRISAAVTFARLHVVPRLGPFLKRYPDLEIDLVLDDRNVDLIGEGIDVALRMGDLPDSSSAARRIGHSRRLVLGTPGYFAAAGEPAAPPDLARHQAIIYAQRGGGEDWTFRQADLAIAVTLSGRLRTTAAEGLREAVLAGLGLAVTSEWMFAAELCSGIVIPVLESWALPAIDLWAMFPNGRRATAKARAFAAFVESTL